MKSYLKLMIQHSECAGKHDALTNLKSGPLVSR
jgi:hypothetical protein